MAKFLHSHNVTATVGTYKDKLTGEEKKDYRKVGAAFTDPETGRISIKLDLVPVSPEWSGWFSLFPVDHNQRPASHSPSTPPPDGGGSASAPAASPPAGTPAPPPPSLADDGDDIPF